MPHKGRKYPKASYFVRNNPIHLNQFLNLGTSDIWGLDHSLPWGLSCDLDPLSARSALAPAPSCDNPKYLQTLPHVPALRTTALNCIITQGKTATVFVSAVSPVSSAICYPFSRLRITVTGQLADSWPQLADEDFPPKSHACFVALHLDAAAQGKGKQSTARSF